MRRQTFRILGDKEVPIVREEALGVKYIRPWLDPVISLLSLETDPRAVQTEWLMY